MFKIDFQGGLYFEVFSSHGTASPLLHWKFINKTFIGKLYEKDLKSYCYSCDKIGKLCLPKNEKLSAHLIQRYLVLQLFLPPGQALSIEMCISDLGKSHRRFFLSTSHKEIKRTALHVNLPLAGIKQGIWLNLCFDLVSFVSDNFPGQVFRSLDSLSLSGTFKLRKVFTLKYRPPDTTGFDLTYSETSPMECIPRALHFPMGVESLTQVVTMSRLSSSISDPKAKKNQTKQLTTSLDLAFGTRVRSNKIQSKEISVNKSTADEKQQVFSYCEGYRKSNEEITILEDDHFHDKLVPHTKEECVPNQENEVDSASKQNMYHESYHTLESVDIETKLTSNLNYDLTEEPQMRESSAESEMRQAVKSLGDMLLEMQADSELTLKTPEVNIDKTSPTVIKEKSQSLFENHIVGEEDENLDIVYDPVRNCFIDSKTGKCYELDLSSDSDN